MRSRAGPYATWFLRDYDRAARLVDTAMLAAHLSTLGFVLGGLGLALLTLQKRTIGLALCLGVAGNLWFFFAYDVHDVEVFFLPSAAVISVGIGPLLTGLQEALAQSTLRHAGHGGPRSISRTTAAPNAMDDAA